VNRSLQPSDTSSAHVEDEETAPPQQESPGRMCVSKVIHPEPGLALGKRQPTGTGPDGQRTSAEEQQVRGSSPLASSLQGDSASFLAVPREPQGLRCTCGIDTLQDGRDARLPAPPIQICVLCHRDARMPQLVRDHPRGRTCPRPLDASHDPWGLTSRRSRVYYPMHIHPIVDV
jgi:hypothetical protein